MQTSKISTSLLLLLLLVADQLMAAGERCKVDDRVKFILRSMNQDTVRLGVDCITGTGPCDEIGNYVRQEAQSAVRSGKCGAQCSCQEISARLVVNKMSREYPAQWQRVLAHFNNK
jgi:hypothetical protein